MEKNKKEIEKEDDIDVRKIYLTNFKPHKPRVGREYQAIIPECISSTKSKESKKINENNNLSNNNKINNDKKELIDNTKSLPNNSDKNEEIQNKIIGHKTYGTKNENDTNDEYIPSKKKKH